MEFNEVVKDIVILFGGTSVVLIALVGFLAHISTKRIINGDLAKHKLELEALKSDNKIVQDSLKREFDKELEDQKSNNKLTLDAFNQEYSSKLELQKAENANLHEGIRNEMQTAFLKSETYTSITKEMFQSLFTKRIKVYSDLLNLKNEIDNSIVKNAEYIEIHDDDPSHFTQSVEQINEASQKSAMLISNELASLSNELFKKSSQVFSSAKVQAFYAEQSSFNIESGHSNFEAVMDAKDAELRKMFTECGDIYESWFVQLEKDISGIRSVLDFTGDFLKH